MNSTNSGSSCMEKPRGMPAVCLQKAPCIAQYEKYHFCYKLSSSHNRLKVGLNPTFIREYVLSKHLVMFQFTDMICE